MLQRELGLKVNKTPPYVFYHISHHLKSLKPWRVSMLTMLTCPVLAERLTCFIQHFKSWRGAVHINVPKYNNYWCAPVYIFSTNFIKCRCNLWLAYQYYWSVKWTVAQAFTRKYVLGCGIYLGAAKCVNNMGQGLPVQTTRKVVLWMAVRAGFAKTHMSAL